MWAAAKSSSVEISICVSSRQKAAFPGGPGYFQPQPQSRFMGVYLRLRVFTMWWRNK